MQPNQTARRNETTASVGIGQLPAAGSGERSMKTVAQHIPAYSYGTAQVPKSPASMREFVELQTSAGFPDEELRYLRLAGEVLRGRTRQIVEHRRAGIIAGIPNLARHSRAPEGDVLPSTWRRATFALSSGYWIPVCGRTIKTGSTTSRKSRFATLARKRTRRTACSSTPYVPLRDIIAFVTVLNETIRPYLAGRGNPAEEVDGMHRAWCKSLHLELALWTRAYSGRDEW